MKEYGKLVNRLDIALYNGKIFGGGEEIFRLSSNIFIHPRTLWGLLSFFRLNPKKLSVIINHKTDLVTSQDPFIFGLIGLGLARWFLAPLQIQVHTDVMSSYFRRESVKNYIYYLIAKFIILPRAEGVRVVSNRIKDSLKKVIKLKTEPEVLPVWIDVEGIKKAEIKNDLRKKYPEFENIILMASRITIEKNIKMAVFAMRYIKDKYPKTGLIVVGSGPLLKKIKNLTHKYGLGDNIKFEDWSDNLASYYKTSDIFLNTSDYEGYGRTIVEALSAGTPVITTDIGCARDYIKDRENGFIIPVRGTDKLVETLNEILSGKITIDLLKKGAKNTALKIPSQEKYLQMYSENWNKTLNYIKI